MCTSKLAGFAARLAVADLPLGLCESAATDQGGTAAQLVGASRHAVIEQRGAPKAIRRDNGPEFTSRHLFNSCEKRPIRLELGITQEEIENYKEPA